MDGFADQAFKGGKTAAQVAGAFFVFIDQDFRGDGVEIPGFPLCEMADQAALAKLFQNVVSGDAVDGRGRGEGGNGGGAVLDTGEINLGFFFV
mgnify:CR=1 FL=1